MKTIVVPTDFSTAAGHAALYAAELAKSIQATVLLVHVYQLPIAMSDFPLIVVSADEMKQNADSGLARVKEEMEQKVQGISLQMESRMGDVVTEIEDICKDREVVALVTGTKDLSGFERFLTGNTTLSIVKNCHYPVIAVPEGCEIKTPKQIALAVDFLQTNEIPVQKITELTDLFQAELHLVHVEQEGEDIEATQLPAALQTATFHSLKDDDVSKGIAHFASEKNIDLVVVLPHKHNLYERIFFKGHTQDIIQTMAVPVLCIK